MGKLICLIALALLPATMMGDSFTAMWKKVAEAQSKDLPKTQIEWLGKIIDKAEREKAYGHLLKAQLQQAATATQIAPDSAAAETERLEQKALQAKDGVLRAVYASVLGNVYGQRGGEGAEAKSRMWFARSMEQPELLARHKCTEYAPAIAAGLDSRIFYDDLLHVIGFEAKAYGALHDHYARSGNRAGACIAACYQLQQERPQDQLEMRKSRYLQRVDSLISVYGDLREAGELAIEHYNVIAASTDATVEDRINYINYALSRWGAWPRMNILRNAQSELQEPSFNINIGDYMLLPNAERKLRVNSIRNVGMLQVALYRVNVSGDTELDPSDKDDYAKLQRLVVPGAVQTVTRRYIGQPAWKENSDSIILDKLPVGVYLVEATTDNDNIEPQRALLRVSNLYVMHEALPDKRTRFVVVNATTGQPVAGAHLVLTLGNWRSDSHQKAMLTSDGRGEASFREEGLGVQQVYVYTDDDRACGNFDVDGYYNHWERNAIQARVAVFTDRAIYRPGQPVHVSALAYRADSDELTSRAIDSRALTFTLHDANGKEVGKKETVTDGFGTAAADFTLPAQGLTGEFSVVVRGDGLNGSASFRVEQYRRPTFRVEFEAYKEAYQPGDTVRMRAVAKTYADVPVQGARVSYTVERRRSLWWGWGGGETVTLWTDSTTTADDGSFTAQLPMTLPDEADRPLYYKVVVRAKVTDGAGETHEAEASLPLSNRTSVLTVDLPTQSLRDSLKTFTFTRQNIAGEQIAGAVRYRFDEGAWHTAEANTAVAIDRRLASGKHRLLAICETDTLEHDLVVFTLDDKKPAFETHDWCYVSADRFPADGKPVYVQLGSSDDDVHVYYSVLSGDKVLGQGARVLHNEVVTEKLAYKEAYGDALIINLAWVKRGHLYTHRIQLLRPEPRREMKLAWKTFRDQLTPGQKEEWTLQVLGPDGRPAQAQLLATMYDKSLDNIEKHYWNFAPSYVLRVPSGSPWNGGSNAAVGLYGFQGYKSLPERMLDFAHFDEDMLDFALPHLILTRALSGRSAGVRIRGAKPMAMAKEMEETAAVMEDIAMNTKSNVMLQASQRVADGAATEGQGESRGEADAQLRENLDETVFFFPALTTDAQGNVAIKFTLPESVTTWHFMGMAHDRDINYGLITADAVAKKTVMVQPNLPRFLRVCDKAAIATRIANTSERSVSGTARLQLLNPETEVVVCAWSKPFSAKAGQTVGVDFDVDAAQLALLGKGATLFIARVSAEGKGFGDGEQHYLPLLPNRERVTTTVPFTQHGAGTKTVDIARLFPTADSQNKLTIEYTNNPAWLAIQALPSMASPSDKNALSLAAAIYANTIGQRIVGASPKIRQTIRLWQQERGKETSLMGNLQRNEELKSMVLGETPWMAEAEHEADQRQQLAGFLDETAIGYRVGDYTAKLKALQNGDGSFSWWPGMRGSSYMTAAVAETLTRLDVMVGIGQDAQNLLNKAMAYLDQQMAEEVTELRQQEKKGAKQLMPSETACRYLYTSALGGRAATKDATYLVGLLEKMPTALTIYGKANSAVILSYYGKVQRAKEYMQSMNEYSVSTAEMGRYYDTPRAQYSWFSYKIPTQVAAIEATKRLAPADTQTTEELQRWLLQEKRTTGWGSPLNAVNAVYALMTNADNAVDMAKLAQGEPTVLRLDGKAIDLPQATAGLGYVKTTIQAPRATTFTAEKTSGGTSWGAVYAQSWQRSTEVDDASAGLTVRREIVAADGNGKPGRLKVGDKVRVRITIKADRDYDFVQVQDRRAACLEPASQLSGYRYGYYCAPQDNATNYYFDRMGKGTHVVETDYYVDRVGDYTTGTCTAQCAYSPEYMGRQGTATLSVTR